jgi:hypothetical protein
MRNTHTYARKKAREHRGQDPMMTFPQASQIQRRSANSKCRTGFSSTGLFENIDPQEGVRIVYVNTGPGHGRAIEPNCARHGLNYEPVKKQSRNEKRRRSSKPTRRFSENRVLGMCFAVFRKRHEEM